MTTPQSPPAGDEQQALTDKRFSTFNDELIERYFNAEGKAALSAYILAQVEDIVGDNGLIDPNDPAGREGAAWKYNAKAELRREILATAQARFGAEGGKI